MNKVAFITLGCKLNFSESSTLARQFAAAGWEEIKPGPDADLFVVNTCSVTEHADKKCRNLIRRLHHLAPDARIAVTDPVYPVYVDSNVMAGRTGTYDPETGTWSDVIYMPCTARGSRF